MLSPEAVPESLVCQLKESGARSDRDQSSGCLERIVFFWFLEFLDIWVWDSKNLQQNQKKKKNNPEWTYPRFFLEDCFFGFPRVFQ